MTYKCSVCSTGLATIDGLIQHVDEAHPDAACLEQTAGVLALVVPEKTSEEEVLRGLDLDFPALCICGEAIKQWEDMGPGVWVHTTPSYTPCLEAVPVKRTLASQGRRELAERLEKLRLDMERQHQDIQEMTVQTEGVLERLRQMERPAHQTSTIRRAALNRAWDVLMDAGNITGAQLVMQLIKREVS